MAPMSIGKLSPTASDSEGAALSSNDLDRPLYVRIHEYLAERIFSGALAPDSKLPSERELSRDLDVSRMTARRAITELVNEGLLTRRHGSGTYVAKAKVTYGAEELISYGRAMRARGIAVTSQLLEFGEVPASRRLADRLQVEIGQPLYRVLRLRLANRVPTILEKMYFSCLRCPRLEEYDLEKTSIYDLLTEGYGVRIGRVDQTVEAVTASDITASQLRVEEGSPMLMISLIVYRSEDDKPVMYSQDMLRSDYARVHFRVTMPT